MQKRVMLYGADPVILFLRGQVLQRGGFHVSFLFRLSDISVLGEEEPIDLMVLCHTVTALQQRQAFALAKATWSELKVIILTGILGDDPHHWGESLSIFDGPQALIDLSRLLIL